MDGEPSRFRTRFPFQPRSVCLGTSFATPTVGGGRRGGGTPAEGEADKPKAWERGGDFPLRPFFYTKSLNIASISRFG